MRSSNKSLCLVPTDLPPAGNGPTPDAPPGAVDPQARPQCVPLLLRGATALPGVGVAPAGPRGHRQTVRRRLRAEGLRGGNARGQAPQAQLGPARHPKDHVRALEARRAALDRGQQGVHTETK